MFRRRFRKLIVGAFTASAVCTPLFAVDAIQTNRTEFNIPFVVDNVNGASPSGDAQLFRSLNGGNMEHVDTVKASAGKFTFPAAADGLYEFTVRMTDAAGKPIGVTGPLLPEIAVEVDTVAPNLNIRLVESSPGEVSVQWSCTENKVAAGSLRLEYAEGTDGRWMPVAAAPGANGKTSIKSTAGTAVSVRGFISDLAGNQGGGSSQIVLAANTPSPAVSNFAGSVNSGSPVGMSPFSGSNGSAIELPANIATPARDIQPPNPVVSGVPFPPTAGAAQAPAAFPAGPILASPGNMQGGVLPNAGNVQPFAGGGGVMAQNQHPVQGNRNTTNRGARQLVNHQVFNIDYQVDDVGPSGIGAVELFVTENNGREWFAYGNDIDMRSPFQVDTLGEGTFGFAVRVRNGLGFRATPPQPGELPNIVVTVDKTAPVAEMAQPQVIVDRVGQIRVAWRVSDQNPSATPVRLEYAASALSLIHI